MSKSIDFYFDFISHNAYLMWHELPSIADKYGYELRPIPALFAGFLKTYGQLGPAEVAPKLAWMNRNVLRKAIDLNIPFAAPVQHPFRPLFLLRLVAQDMTIAERCALTGLLFRGVWADKLDPNQPQAVCRYLEQAGFAVGERIDRTADASVKEKLKLNTDKCIARGGFGVPTVLVGDELFWGFDDLPYLERHLAGDDSLKRVDLDTYLSEWKTGRAHGAHRPQPAHV
jgi:2-hydroxychromene-2-carboxylate isomerase